VALDDALVGAARLLSVAAADPAVVNGGQVGGEGAPQHALGGVVSPSLMDGPEQSVGSHDDDAGAGPAGGMAEGAANEGLANALRPEEEDIILRLQEGEAEELVDLVAIVEVWAEAVPARAPTCGRVRCPPCDRDPLATEPYTLHPVSPGGRETANRFAGGVLESVERPAPPTMDRSDLLTQEAGPWPVPALGAPEGKPAGTVPPPPVHLHFGGIDDVAAVTHRLQEARALDLPYRASTSASHPQDRTRGLPNSQAQRLRLSDSPRPGGVERHHPKRQADTLDRPLW